MSGIGTEGPGVAEQLGGGNRWGFACRGSCLAAAVLAAGKAEAGLDWSCDGCELSAALALSLVVRGGEEAAAMVRDAGTRSKSAARQRV